AVVVHPDDVRVPQLREHLGLPRDAGVVVGVEQARGEQQLQRDRLPQSLVGGQPNLTPLATSYTLAQPIALADEDAVADRHGVEGWDEWLELRETIAAGLACPEVRQHVGAGARVAASV